MSAPNGNFSQQNHYGTATEQYPNTNAAAETSASNTNGNSDLSKDEIGWYFVEQYYTTLSKNPDKLNLFYGKRSHMVFGQEAESSPVSYGRQAIKERIQALDFQDCKVRVSNVDSQASDENIVIQVIGETSNKSAELKKFVQTFVLAQQPTGYFVLNDIFRYIIDESAEETEAAAGAEQTTEAPVTEGVEMPAQQAVEEQSKPVDVEVVDKKLEETAEEPPKVLQDEAKTNGDVAAAMSAPVEAEDAPVAAAPAAEETPAPEVIEKELEQEEVKEAEKPKDPVPTPEVKAAQPVAAKAPEPAQAPKPAAPAAPAKPMSWASRVAANTPKPALPQTQSAAPAAKAAAPAAPRAAPAAAASSASAPAAPAASPAATKTSDESQWQSVGNGKDHAGKKAQHQQQQQQGGAGGAQGGAGGEKEGTLGYVRNVTEGVKTEELRAALAQHGELVYFDVNRGKNCAFVEFATTAGYQAAVAANPHQVGGESIIVEPRRPKSQAYGGAGYQPRGGAVNGGGRGRGGFGGPNRGRGGAAGAGAQRGGRGGAQAGTTA